MSLVLSLMQPIRLKYATGAMDKLEMRRSRYGAWRFFQEQSRMTGSIITDDLQAAIKRSMGNTIQVPVLDAEDVVITNVRSCTVAPSENTSKLVTLTFATYAFGFTMYPAQHFNNQVSYQQDFDRKFEKYVLKLAATLDTAAVNKLELGKNQYFPADLLSFYPQIGGALQVTQAQKNDFYNQAEAVLNTMDFYGSTNVISSTTGKPMVNRIAAQGGANAVNEAFQLGGYEWNYTNRIINGAGVQATQYLVADGMVGVSNRNDPDAIMGSRVGTQKIWSLVNVPVVDLQMANYYYEDCGNASALHAGTAHLTRTKVEGFEWSTDVVFVQAYNSDPATRYQPIIKAEISAA